MTRRDSSPADDPPSNGQARQDAADDGQTPREGDAEGSNRKERVLHTRVPAVLERELKRFADNLRIPVSNLVRTILEDAVSVADRAGDRVEERLRTAAEHLGHERERLRAETAKLEAQIMAEARAETARILEAGKARIAGEVAEMKRELERGQPALAAEIATRILGRDVRPS